MHAKYYTRIHIVKALQVHNINFFLHGIIHELDNCPFIFVAQYTYFVIEYKTICPEKIGFYPLF